MNIHFTILMAALAMLSCRNSNATSDTSHEVVSVADHATKSKAKAKTKAKASTTSVPIDRIPSTAQLSDRNGRYAVYLNTEEEGEEYVITTVWLADEEAGTAELVCRTDPMAPAQWGRMSARDANAVEVSLDEVAAADKAWVVPGETRKVIVEGCPDARNVWTYIIDVDTHTAWQLPSTEGVDEVDWDKQEITTSSYGYYEDGEGRYTYKVAYSTDGQYLRH